MYSYNTQPVDLIKCKLVLRESQIMLFTLILLVVPFVLAQECQKRDYGNGGHVCVCSSKHCDTVAPVVPITKPNYLIYTSNKAGLRFNQSKGAFIKTSQLFDNEILVNSNEKYQNILGWGGAFTDATGININSLDKEAQDRLLNSYFSDNGNEYSLCRVPIGGTDFSERAYSYNDGSKDPNLTNFLLQAEDYQYKIPLIKKAMNLTKGNLKLFASAWTAPKWMKTNGEYNGFGFLKEEMYQSWADYFVKFLEKYDNEDLNFWGLTTGNEPSLGLLPAIKINSVGWTPNMMATFIRRYLGPKLRKSKYANIKLMTLDDQRFFLPWFANIALRLKSTSKYVDGIAVHWYQDNIFPPSLLQDTHNNFPDKFLLATEACHGDKPGQKSVLLGSWARGEMYADDIIQDVLNWVAGWVDWNMALDTNGGPTYIKNFVDSPIIVNATAGEFYKQPMFYNLGHFSKFVPVGSTRIGVTNSVEKVPVAAFLRPDNGTAVVILNKNDRVIPITLVDDSRGTSRIELSQRSITTILYW